MVSSFPIQRKWLDSVKDTMTQPQFAELNYRINSYAIYGEIVEGIKDNYVEGCFNLIKPQIDNMNNSYQKKKSGRPAVFNEDELEGIKRMAIGGYSATQIAAAYGWDERKKKAIYDQDEWKNRKQIQKNSFIF